MCGGRVARRPSSKQADVSGRVLFDYYPQRELRPARALRWPFRSPQRPNFGLQTRKHALTIGPRRANETTTQGPHMAPACEARKGVIDRRGSMIYKATVTATATGRATGAPIDEHTHYS